MEYYIIPVFGMINNKLMSTNNTDYSQRNNFMTSSSMIFGNPFPKSNNYQFSSATNGFPKREFTEVSSPQLQVPHRNIATQSMIFTPNTEMKPKLGGFSKLDSMARHINPSDDHFMPKTLSSSETLSGNESHFNR